MFNRKGTLVLWLQETDSRLVNFLSERYPLSERSRIRLGPPPEKPVEASSHLDESGRIVLRQGETPRPYLPAQPPVTTWFAMVRNWLARLQSRGTSTPELEREIQPGVFAGHHCRIAPGVAFRAPCWIGNHSEVRGGVFGPNAVVGEHCIVGPRTRIAESYVLGNTCVGSDLVLEGVVAGANRLLGHAHGEPGTVVEDFMLRKVGP